MLAEKLETVIARSTLNTRMCDFYDIHILWSEKADIINIDTLRRAIINVARKRRTIELFDNTDEILRDIVESDYLRNNWSNYKTPIFPRFMPNSSSPVLPSTNKVAFAGNYRK